MIDTQVKVKADALADFSTEVEPKTLSKDWPM